MRSLAALFVLLLLACGACGGTVLLPGPSLNGPESIPDPIPSALCASQPVGQVTNVQGEVAGIWSGQIVIEGPLVIAENTELEICPGTTLTSMDPRATMLVNGSVIFSGTKEAMILFNGMPWSGIEVHGKLTGGYLQMGSLLTCIDGRNTSEISLVGARLVGCEKAFVLWNGARFDHLFALAGHTSTVHGGVLSMIDSEFDLRHDGIPPDCVYWSAGGAQIDHSRIHGCHCPIHVEEAPLGFHVTNSIFDGASTPIMIAKTQGEFSGNNIPVGHPHVLDIGGDLNLDLSNNYWGGDAPKIISDELDHIAGTSEFASEPFQDVGPR